MNIFTVTLFILSFAYLPIADAQNHVDAETFLRHANQISHSKRLDLIDLRVIHIKQKAPLNPHVFEEQIQDVLNINKIGKKHPEYDERYQRVRNEFMKNLSRFRVAHFQISENDYRVSHFFFEDSIPDHLDVVTISFHETAVNDKNSGNSYWIRHTRKEIKQMPKQWRTETAVMKMIVPESTVPTLPDYEQMNLLNQSGVDITVRERVLDAGQPDFVQKEITHEVRTQQESTRTLIGIDEDARIRKVEVYNGDNIRVHSYRFNQYAYLESAGIHIAYDMEELIYDREGVLQQSNQYNIIECKINDEVPALGSTESYIHQLMEDGYILVDLN